MRLNFDECKWFICKQCNTVFNDILMREVYAERTQQQEEMLLSFPEGEARENARTILANPGVCPNCSAAEVKGIVQLGRKHKRILQRQQWCKEFIEWVTGLRKKLLPST